MNELKDKICPFMSSINTVNIQYNRTYTYFQYCTTACAAYRTWTDYEVEHDYCKLIEKKTILSK